MATPLAHAESSVKQWGGVVEDYLPIHNWFDASKEHFADFRHRALRHHSAGIFECEQVFGVYLTNSTGRKVPVRVIGEQHVREDCGWIPTVADWLRTIQAKPWMNGNVAKLSKTQKGEISANESRKSPAVAGTGSDAGSSGRGSA